MAEIIPPSLDVQRRTLADLHIKIDERLHEVRIHRVLERMGRYALGALVVFCDPLREWQSSIQLGRQVGVLERLGVVREEGVEPYDIAMAEEGGLVTPVGFGVMLGQAQRDAVHDSLRELVAAKRELAVPNLDSHCLRIVPSETNPFLPIGLTGRT